MSRRLRFDWKCPDCGMTQRKEPHRKLADHMEAAHGKRWSDEAQRYLTPAGRSALAEFDAVKQQEQAAGEDEP